MTSLDTHMTPRGGVAAAILRTRGGEGAMGRHCNRFLRFQASLKTMEAELVHKR